MMGKLGGIVLILMLLMWCCNTRKTVVEFNLIGSSGIQPELMVNGEEREIEVDDSGYAKLMLTGGERGYATLKYGKDRLPLFIEGGTTLQIYIYGDHAKGNIRFEGDGSPKNSYLNSQVMKNLSVDYELNAPEFLGQLKDLIQEQFHYLDTMGFDAAFTEMERNRIKFSTYKALENYPLYHAWSTGNTDYQLDTAYLSCIKKLIKEDEKLLVLKEYQEGMASLVSLISTYHMKELDAYKQVMAQFDYVIHHLTNETLVEFLIDHYAYAYLLGVGIDEHIDDVLRVYDFYVKDPALRKRFQEIYDRCAKIVPGSPAFDFMFTDIAGQAVELEDFRGKYLFINVWTTWGVPCRYENLAWEKLEKEFEDENIVFVAVSCDNDRAVWEKRVRENPKGEVQLYMGSDRSFMDFYMIRGIPRFILIAPDGRIINSDMSRPSDPETAKALRAYLKEK